MDRVWLTSSRDPIPSEHFGQQTPLSVQSSAGKDMNELLLYHGCDAARTGRLFEQGLDPRYAGSNAGKMFGAGTYLACHASKSDIYTKPLFEDGEHEGERCVLVVRTCLGAPHYERNPTVDNRAWLMPPERPDGRGPS